MNHYLKLVMESGLYLEYVRDFNIDFEIGSIRRRDHPFVPGLNVIMGKSWRKCQFEIYRKSLKPCKFSRCGSEGGLLF